MEKFRRFDDPSCGINPFVIPRPKPSFCKRFFTAIFNLIIFPPKFILFLCIFALLCIVKFTLSIIFIKKVRRKLERFSSYTLCSVLLALVGVYSTEHKFYHYTHPKHSYHHTLNKTAGAEFNDDTAPGDLILSTQSTFIEYLVLQKLYSPSYSSVDLDTGKLQLLTGLRLILFAIGARVTQSINKTRKIQVKLDSLDNLLSSSRPLVLFVEGCKTNGLGVLKLHQEVQGAIYNLIKRENFTSSINTFRLDYVDRSSNPANTTDDCGCESIVQLLTKCYTPVERWHYFHLEDHLKEIQKLTSDRCGKQAQLALVSNYKRYPLQIDGSLFPEFLKFWKLAQNKKYIT